VISLADVASAIVAPAVNAVFRDGEVSAIHLSIDEAGGGSVALSITARGETYFDHVVQVGVDHATAADWRERLRSNLADFVAESRFGWGENRDTGLVVVAPTPAGVEQALAVAQRWLPAFLEGRRAADDVYAEGVTTWHNIGERESEIQRTPSRTRTNESGADLHVHDVRLRVFDGGWVLQSTTRGTNAAGDEVRIPSCLVVTLRAGKIARFEEYADSRAAEKLFGTD
jgi:ketosteroid isomerase-like protein